MVPGLFIRTYGHGFDFARDDQGVLAAVLDETSAIGLHLASGSRILRLSAGEDGDDVVHHGVYAGQAGGGAGGQVEGEPCRGPERSDGSEWARRSCTVRERRPAAGSRQQQAAALVFFDIFWVCAVLSAALTVLILLMKRSVAEKGELIGAE